MLNMEGMDEKKRDPDQVTLFRRRGAVIVLCIVIAVLILKYKGNEKNDLWNGWVDPEKIRKGSAS